MPAYQYQCQSCLALSDFITSINDIPINPLCSNCRSVNTVRIFTPPYIVSNKTKSRVYYQWKGDPKDCPSDIRNLLKDQKEKPRGISEFAKEGEPALGTG